MANAENMYRGREVWLYVNDGTDASPDWKAVACTTSKSFNGDTESIETTNDCDQGEFGSSAGGNRTWTFEASAQALKEAGIESNQVSHRFAGEAWKTAQNYQWRMSSIDDEFYVEGPGYVSSFSITGETADFVVFDITITGTGEPIFEPEV